MIQAQDKPKILLLRKRTGEHTLPAHADAWIRLAKALKTFTDFEEVEIPENTPVDMGALLPEFDHFFLDLALADWPALHAQPIPCLTLVSLDAFGWDEPELRNRTLPVHAAQPCLVLDGLSASDLVRVLHLFLMPKRLAGVAPMMEKGSLIVGEKLMDAFNIGSLLDRFAAHLDAQDGLELKVRIPDLRQVLSALVHEGLRCAGAANVSYPFVDFQASATRRKIGVNFRFPKGALALDQLLRQILSGGDLFWHQVWQCSDVVVLTEHRQHDELEVMLVLCRPERPNSSRFNTLLFKTVERSPQKENLLEAPDTYFYRQLSEIQPKESANLMLTSPANIEELDLSALPESVALQFQDLDEKCRILNENLLHKESALQDSIRKNQTLNHELSLKRGELLRAMKTLEVQADASEKRIRELEERLLKTRASAAETADARESHVPAGMQDAMARLEAALRAAESERTALRENVAHEQRRVTIFEQKYSALYRDISIKEREINELKGAFNKLRKEQSAKQASPGAIAEAGSAPPEKVKEYEARDLSQRQEIRKLSFKLDNQEKYMKAQQAEAAEKLNILEQKLKAAKAKELELLKKVEELMAALKRAHKAA